MKTEVEIRRELERTKFELAQRFGQLDSDPDVVRLKGRIEGLSFTLGPMPPEKAVAFACPKCGSGLLKIEPCSGYYSYCIDKYTGEVVYHNNDFNSESTDDPWYECERCQWKADGKWEDWYAKERPTEGDEEDSDG